MSECRFYGMCETAYDIGCDGTEDTACAYFEPMPDVDALASLAAALDVPGTGWVAYAYRTIASSIREALGVKA